MQNPKNVDFHELKRILEMFGYEGRPPGGGSSHWVFRSPGARMHITIPFKKPVGRVYVNNIITQLALEEWYEENCR
jgi:hypothetical protein